MRQAVDEGDGTDAFGNTVSHCVVRTFFASTLTAFVITNALVKNLPPGRPDFSVGQHPSMGWTFLTGTIDGTCTVRSAIAPDVNRQIAALGISLGNFVWSQSGRYLYFEGLSQEVRNLWRITVEPRTLEWIEGPYRLTTGAGHD